MPELEAGNVGVGGGGSGAYLVHWSVLQSAAAGLCNAPRAAPAVYMRARSIIFPRVRQTMKTTLIHFLYPISILSGYKASQKPKHKYRDHLN